MSEPPPKPSVRRRIITGSLYGWLIGTAIGPGAMRLLVGTLPPETQLDQLVRLWLLWLASLGVMPVGAAAGAVLAHITRPGR